MVCGCKIKRKCGLFVFTGLMGLMLFRAFASKDSLPDQQTAIMQSYPQMNFVLGTDPNFLFPTLVTVHSLLKNITAGTRVRVIIVLYGEAVNFLDFIVAAFRKLNKKFKGSVAELVLINGCDGPFVNMATQLPFPAYRRDSNSIFIQAKTAIILSAIPNNSNDDQPIFSLSHYMWLDSDVLIKSDAAIPYEECLKSGCPFGAVNRFFVETKGITGWQGVSGETGAINLFHRLSDDEEGHEGGIQGPLTLVEQENTGSLYFGKRRWNTSGGFCFVNLLCLINLVQQYEISLEILPDKLDDEMQTDYLAVGILSKITKSGGAPGKMMFALPCKYNFKTREIETLRTLFQGLSSGVLLKQSGLQEFIRQKAEEKEQGKHDVAESTLLDFLDGEPKNLKASLESLAEVELMFRNPEALSINIHYDRDIKPWNTKIHKNVVKAARGGASLQSKGPLSLKDVVDQEWSKEFVETMKAIGYDKSSMLTVQKATEQLKTLPRGTCTLPNSWYVICVNLQTARPGFKTYAVNS